jgi:hypothetical protein
MDITVTLTDAEVLAVQALAGRTPVADAVASNVRTWLAPTVVKIESNRAEAVRVAYTKADATVQQKVRAELKVESR